MLNVLFYIINKNSFTESKPSIETILNMFKVTPGSGDESGGRDPSTGRSHTPGRVNERI